MSVIGNIRDNIKKVMIGNETTIDLLLTAMIAGGHVLLEDVPGTGKTVMAKAIAKSVDAKFGRIQFTPDLLPSDVTGLNMYDSRSNEFVFSEGPAFCNILLADEINRATPKTQSALLECMAEGQITVDKVTRKLEAPYLVIATQNPLETLGTFPLPEAQLDRFLMQLSMEELDTSNEKLLINRFINDAPLEKIGAVASKEDIVVLQEQCKGVYIHDDLQSYIVELVQGTRQHAKLSSGVSPRGTLAFVRACQAHALVEERNFVVPEDIKAVAVPVLAHRITSTMVMDGKKTAVSVIEELLSSISLPTEDFSKRI